MSLIRPTGHFQGPPGADLRSGWGTHAQWGGTLPWANLSDIKQWEDEEGETCILFLFISGYLGFFFFFFCIIFLRQKKKKNALVERFCVLQLFFSSPGNTRPCVWNLHIWCAHMWRHMSTFMFSNARLLFSTARTGGNFRGSLNDLCCYNGVCALTYFCIFDAVLFLYDLRGASSKIINEENEMREGI